MDTVKELQRERVISYNLHKYLAAQGLSEDELALRLSCDTLKLKEILTGSVAASEEFLHSIAQGLGIAESDLEAVPDDDELSHYNVHYMGKAADSQSMIELLNKVDFYVRLLNVDKSR